MHTPFRVLSEGKLAFIASRWGTGLTAPLATPRRLSDKRCFTAVTSASRCFSYNLKGGKGCLFLLPYVFRFLWGKKIIRQAGTTPRPTASLQAQRLAGCLKTHKQPPEELIDINPVHSKTELVAKPKAVL